MNSHAIVYVPTRVGEGFFTDFQAPASGSTDNGKVWSWDSLAGKFIPNISVSAFGLTLIDDVDAATARSTLGLGTAAPLNVGTGANNVVQLTAAAKLPAVDGSLLTGITATASPGGSSTQVQYNNGGEFAGHSGMTYNGDGALTVAGRVVTPVLSQSGASREYHRNVASYVSAAQPETGTIKITMPKKASSSMVSMTIRGCNYSADVSSDWELFLSFYNFSDGGMYGVGAELRGTAAPFSSVRLGNDGSNDCILLGTTATNWSRPRIDITDIAVSNGSITGWQTGWSITRITSETGITVASTPSIVYAGKNVFTTLATSVPASTDTTFNSFFQQSGQHYARWGVVDPGSGFQYRGMYLQGGSTGSVLYYNVFLNPLGGNVAIGIPPATLTTALLDLATSTTARASLRIRAGTAPTSPNDGDVWYNGTDYYLRSTVNYSVGPVVRTTAIRPVSDSTTALQLQNAAGTAIMTVDTTNKQVLIGSGSTTAPFTVKSDFAGGRIVHFESNAASQPNTQIVLNSPANFNSGFIWQEAGADKLGIFYNANQSNIGRIPDTFEIFSFVSVAPIFQIHQSAGANSFVIGSTSNVGISVSVPTAAIDLAASTTARASLRVRSGTAPTTPNAGDIWYDGTNYYLRSTVNYSVGPVVRTTAIRPVSDSTTALQLQNAAGTAVMTVDTTNGRLNIHDASPAASATATIIENDADPSNTSVSATFIYGTPRLYLGKSGASIYALNLSNCYAIENPPTITWAGSTVMLASDGVSLFERNNNDILIHGGTFFQRLLFNAQNASTSTVSNAYHFRATNSGTPAAGFGCGLRVGIKSTTTDDQDAGRLTWEWVTATHASRASRGKLSAYAIVATVNTEQTAITWDGDSGGIKLGFYNVTPVARQVLATGTGATVDQVITALQNIGILRQS